MGYSLSPIFTRSAPHKKVVSAAVYSIKHDTNKYSSRLARSRLTDNAELHSIHNINETFSRHSDYTFPVTYMAKYAYVIASLLLSLQYSLYIYIYIGNRKIK